MKKSGKRVWSVPTIMVHYCAHLNFEYKGITNKQLVQNLNFLDRDTLNNILLKNMKLKMCYWNTEFTLNGSVHINYMSTPTATLR